MNRELGFESICDLLLYEEDMDAEGFDFCNLIARTPPNQNLQAARFRVDRLSTPI
jgi:hypothetical protein